MPDEIYYFRDSDIPAKLDDIPQEILLPLRDGLRRGLLVEIDYTDSAGEESTRRILPEVFFRYSDTWYVAAYCTERDDSRTFRMDRIGSAELTDIPEESCGIAEDIRTNGIPWKREPPGDPALTKPDEKGGLWYKLNIVDGENGPEIKIESSNKDPAPPKTARDLSFDLIYDAERGRIDRMNEDIAGGADVNFMNRSERTALIAAARNGFFAAVKFLLEHGADPFLKGGDGTTALIAATRSRNRKLVEYLLEDLKLELNVRDKLGWSPLYCAVLDNQPDLVRYYLDRGADIAVRCRNGKTVLIEAAYGTFTTDEQALELLRLLLERGAEINAADKDGKTALFHAAHRRKLQCVNFLLDSGADLRHYDKKGNPLLLDLLLEQQRCSGNLIADREFYKLIHLLLARGADVNACGRNGITPLMAAPDEMVEYLISLGANPSAADRTGTTVAMYHARSLATLDFLAENGADLRLKNDAGDDVLLLTAATREYYKYLIEKYGFPFDDRNCSGTTLLHRACAAGNLPAVKYLLRHGVDPLAVDKRGFTPRECLQYRHLEEDNCIDCYFDEYLAKKAKKKDAAAKEIVPETG